MRFIWKGKWKEGEITVEAQTAKELDEAIKELKSLVEKDQTMDGGQQLPKIPSILGCTDAVRMLMRTSWGKKARALVEIKKALEKNELFFSKEALSATLVTLVKRGDLMRVKDNGIWAYFTNESEATNTRILKPDN